MSNRTDGRQSPSDDRNAPNATTNERRREQFDGDTAGNLKRLSRELGIAITTHGWVFEDGDQHPLPNDDRDSEGGERA